MMDRVIQSAPAKARGYKGTPETKTLVHGLCVGTRSWQHYSDGQTDRFKLTDGAFTELYSNTKRFTVNQEYRNNPYNFCSDCLQTNGYSAFSRWTSDEQQSPLPLTYLVLTQMQDLSDHRDCIDSCIYGPCWENCSFSFDYPQTSFVFCFQFK